jgi:acyl-CoA thioesterase
MGTYIINHPKFGRQAFGGNVIAKSLAVQVQICDSIRRRVSLASF